MKRLLLLIAPLLILASCSPKVTAVSSNVPDKDIVILYDNDVHCAVDGYAPLAALKKAEQQAGAYVAVVSSGDYVQGGSLGAASKGMYMVQTMNQVGYDVVTLGNHEFDYGIPRLKELASTLTATIVCCNLYDLTTDRRMFEPYKMVDFGGVKVAFVGVATPYSFVAANPSYFRNEQGEMLYSLSIDNIYDTIQNMVDDARECGADYVVMLTHLGIDVENDAINSHTLIDNVTGIDVVLDGHSHDIIPCDMRKDKEGHDVILTSTGASFTNIGKLVISKDGKLSTALIPVPSIKEPDARVVAFVDSLRGEYKAMGEREIGWNECLLRAKDDEGNWIVRADQSGLADFVTDALRARLDADVAFIGGGSIRSNLPQGRVTFNDIFSVFPFDNKCVVVDMPGDVLLDALEMSVFAMPTDYGGMIHSSGLRYNVDLTVESPCVIDINKVFQRVEGKRRVSNVQVLNKETGLWEPLQRDRTYKVAGLNFMMLEGGDGHAELVGLPAREADLSDVQMLEDFIVENLSGKIPASYGKPEGRFTVKR